MFRDPYLGFIIPFAGIHPPENWMFCMGQQLSISEYMELYTVVGATFGGDDIETFALPNLCGRVAVNAGRHQQQTYTAGQSGGQEMVSLSVDNLPIHTHLLTEKITARPPCANSDGTTSEPTGHYPAIINGGSAQYSTNVNNQISMGGATVSATTNMTSDGSGNEPVKTVSPYLVMNYIICIRGLYPSHG